MVIQKRECSTNEFLNEEEKQQYCFATFTKGLSVYTMTEDIPMKVEEVLSEFKGIMVNEIPTWLPLTMSISHKINLIPRLILPNKELHRMTPT